jgi:hypothetical protein
MKQHIFDIVSVKDATFHLETREDLRARSVKVWERAGDELRLTEGTPWADPVPEDLGGGGMYTAASELLKIYQGILNGKLLRLETVKTMFQPQLKSTVGLDNQPEHSPSYRNAAYNAVPSDMPVSFCLGGLLNLAPIPARQSAQSLTWSGMPNCYWVSLMRHSVWETK